MSETVIKVENLSKQYRLGLVGATTIGDDLRRFWAKLRGTEDPSLKSIKENILTNKEDYKHSNYVWALKDINFEVKQGEVLGIIGKNGAGKSTLLKILSRVTSPTTGNIKMKGRIASLLEVGTGFHPELTGRENVFLNGAILGMTKAEIKSKFDEIVDFSGVERYVDTPVKRYSSGMYVRLAFAVAAHLEPEILIVDEVLAVGDAEFQKKCLGKMKDVSQSEGRTVLYVSHNIDSIKQICQSAILLKEGRIYQYSDAQTIADIYLSGYSTKYYNYFNSLDETEKGNNNVKLLGIDTIDENLNPISEIVVDKKIGINITLNINTENPPLINIDICSIDGKYICSAITTKPLNMGNGTYKIIVWIPENLLNDIIYTIGVGVFTPNNSDGTQYSSTIYYYNNKLLQFKAEDSLNSQTRLLYKGVYGSLIRPVFNWDIKKTN